MTLNSPDDAPYLCNMAVAGHVRRKGVATHLGNAIQQVITV